MRWKTSTRRMKTGKKSRKKMKNSSQQEKKQPQLPMKNPKLQERISPTRRLHYHHPARREGSHKRKLQPAGRIPPAGNSSQQEGKSRDRKDDPTTKKESDKVTPQSNT